MALTKPVSGDPGYSGATKASVIIGGIVDSINQGPLNPKDAAYGAVGDGTTDDITALQAGVTALPANNGKIVLPTGTYKISSALSFSGKSGVVFEGMGGLTAGASGATKILYTGTGSQAINAQSSIGFTMRNIQVVYNNSGFTGPLLDLTGGGGTDTSGALIEGVSFFSSSVGTIQTANGIALDKCNSSTIRNCSFGGLAIGITGKATAGYANGIVVAGCHFSASTGNIVTACISETGQSWLVEGNTFEPLVSGVPGAMITTFSNNGLTILGNWCGDSTAGSGSWFNLAAFGGVEAIGNYISLVTGETGVLVHGAGNRALVVKGNNFDGTAGTAINIDTASGLVYADLGPNNYHSGITTISNQANIVTEGFYSDGNGVYTFVGAKVAMGVGGPKLLAGSGTPEGAVTANVGSIYMRTNGGAATSIYVKESGSSNTGWIAK